MRERSDGKNPNDASIDFLAGGGEMGELIRAFDWASTPVGSPETWPPSLRVTVRLMLNSQHPMFIWWGEDLIQFYNDGYRQTMGPEMHPAALGARGRESWADIWHLIGPQIEYVMAGKGATWHEEQLVPINRHGKREDVWWTYGYSPIDLDNRVGGVLVVCNDVTTQHLQTEALRSRTRRMAQQFEAAPGFIAVLRGPEHVFELANAAYRQLIGGRDVLGKTVREALPEMEGQGFIDLLDDVYRSGKSYIGRRTSIMIEQETGASHRRLYLDFVYQPIIESDDTVSGIFVEGQDVTEHVRAEERLALINQELQHRVRNILSMVGAVASQTLREAAGAEAMSEFHARLEAFAAAQRALTEGGDAAGSIADVIRGTFMPHDPGEDRFDIDGPSVLIGSKQVLSLALAIHEMATNAAKYGALSTESGHVEIRWGFEETDEEIFYLTWRERGGPPVEKPSRVGFGSRLIEKVLAVDFGGSVEMIFEPSGFVLALRAPRQNLLGRDDRNPKETTDI